VDLLRGYGYTVYHKGDAAHMQAQPPEDHTPFSATGWPVTSKRWIGHALDIMPNASLKSLPQLAERIIADVNDDVDGTQWIKYINWTDGAGKTWQDRWTPEHARNTSTDKGHIHISARSDMDTSDVVSRSGYTPLGESMSLTATDIALLMRSDTSPDNPAKTYPIGAALYDTVQITDQTRTIASQVQSTVNKFESKLDSVQVDPEALSAALVEALATHPEIVDALATAVASRIGMIPTAREIAKSVGDLTWHGSAEA
jgi:hypothetical protein